jgi:xylulose-5-phosphate/fructose-6-phosphate phosphoketolase
MEATLPDVNARKTGGVIPSTTHRLSADELRKIDAYWRACNYLSACMI